MGKSIFTQIIEGTIPCHKIYEDSKVIAFLDIHPTVEGHVLVVPKQQTDHLWDLDPADYSHTMTVAQNIAPKLQSFFKTKRVGMIVEGFGVPHAHIHLLPVNNSDELRRQPDLESEPDHENLAAMAIKIKEPH